MLVCFVWISFGERPWLSLWSWLHALPVLDNMRMVQRFGIVAVMLFAVFVGFGVDAIERLARRRLPNPRQAVVVAALPVLVLLADLLAVNAPILGEAFPIPPMQVERGPRFEQHHIARRYDAAGWRTRATNDRFATISGLYPAFLANRGTTRGYGVVPVPSRAAPAERRDYRGEAYLVGAGGEVRLAQWTPNRLVLDVRAEGRGVLVVNQNYLPGWSARRETAEDEGPAAVISHAGLLAVRVAPEHRRVVLRYLPRSFVVGAVMSVATLLALVLLGLRRRGRAP